MAKSNGAPERTFRVGNVSASVFVNTVGEGRKRRDFRSVTVQKSYLNGEERKYTPSLNLGDLANAQRAMGLAQQHVEAQEADVSA